MANDMHKELRKVNSAIEYLAKLEDSYSDKTFNLGKNGYKKGTKEYNIALRQQAAAKDQALKKWANWKGSNSYLQVLHDKDIGLMSHGGKMPGARGTLGIGTLKDWTIGQQNFTLNSDGTKYKTGHVSGMLSPSAALESLRTDQAWVVNALGQGRLTQDMYKSMPYAVRHLSGSKNIENEFGSKHALGIPNTIQPGHQGRFIGKEGKVNPFYDSKFVKYDYDTLPSITTKRGFLGIGTRKVKTKGTIDYNLPDYKFFTNHFGDSTFSGSQESRDKGSVLKTRSLNSSSSSSSSSISGDTVYGGGGWFGRGTDIRTSTGGSTALTIHKGDDYYVGGKHLKAGDTLGVLTRKQRARYDTDNPHYMN